MLLQFLNDCRLIFVRRRVCSYMLHFWEYFAKLFLDMRKSWTSIISLSARSLLMTWTRAAAVWNRRKILIFFWYGMYAKYAINGGPTGHEIHFSFFGFCYVPKRLGMRVNWYVFSLFHRLKKTTFSFWSGTNVKTLMMHISQKTKCSSWGYNVHCYCSMLINYGLISVDLNWTSLNWGTHGTTSFFMA